MNNAQSLALNVLFPEEITHQIMSRKKKKKVQGCNRKKSNQNMIVLSRVILMETHTKK